MRRFTGRWLTRTRTFTCACFNACVRMTTQETQNKSWRSLTRRRGAVENASVQALSDTQSARRRATDTLYWRIVDYTLQVELQIKIHLPTCSNQQGSAL